MCEDSVKIQRKASEEKWKLIMEDWKWKCTKICYEAMKKEKGRIWNIMCGLNIEGICERNIKAMKMNSIIMEDEMKMEKWPEKNIS